MIKCTYYKYIRRPGILVLVNEVDWDLADR